jgi:MFS transporter, DHA2 family, multidrug resistance protein
MITPDSQAVPTATRREWIGLAVIALPCMLYSMDLTVLNLAVPSLAADLNPTASQLLWIIDIYGFMVAGFLMTMGTLGDRIGRRKLLMVGAAAFGGTSIIAAFSTSAEMLIVTRALLGVAGATLAPSTLSLITTMFPDPTQRTFAISVWISSFSAGAIIGPVAGGLLIQYFWWGSVFLAGVPVMILLLILGPLLLPEYRDPNAGRLDFTSAAMSLASVLLFIYGVKQAAENGGGVLTLSTMAAGIALGVAFFQRQKRLTDPLIDLRLFSSRQLNTALAINVLGIFFMFGAFIFQAQYLQLVVGLSPLHAALWSLPSAFVFTAASYLTPVLAARFTAAQLLAGGLLLSAAGFVALALATGLYGVIAASLVFSLGFTPVISLTTGIIVGSAPPERAGAASALSETAAELGGALGIAILGSLITAIYRTKMSAMSWEHATPDNIATATATLNGAIEAAQTLPSAEAAHLLTTARAAFMSGFDTLAVLAAIGLFCAAIATLRVLRSAQAAAH